MFYHFGYDSNLVATGLVTQGISALRSEPALLEGWRLCFDRPAFLAIDVGTASLCPSASSDAHGVLFACREEDRERLERQHGEPFHYERRLVVVRTVADQCVTAQAYVRPSTRRARELLPTRQQQERLVRGAREAGLAAEHIEGLLEMETREWPAAPPFLPEGVHAQFSLLELQQSPHLVGLMGWVFDLRTAPADHSARVEAFGARDITLHLLLRHGLIAGRDGFEELLGGSGGAEQRVLLDSYLHEFARHYLLVGSLSYAGEGPANGILGNLSLGAPQSSRSKRSLSPRRESSLCRPPPGAGLARLVIEEADLEYLAAGHENAGYLSERHGFMPRQAPRMELATSHTAWDQILGDLPRLYANLTLRREVEALPLLSAAESALAEEDLLRAAALLAFLAHAYWYVEPRPPCALPRAVEEPWREVSQRLGRTSVGLTYQDLIVGNYRQLRPASGDAMSVANLRLLMPTVDTDAERIFYLTQVAILAHAAPAVGAMARAQEAAEVDDEEVLETELLTILGCLNRITHTDLREIDPNPHSTRYMNPVVWAKTVAPFAVPTVPGQQGPSGTSSPIFNALDVFLGRKRFDTFLGHEIHALRGSYPPLWRRFVAALHEVSVRDYVVRKDKPALSGLMHEVFDAYSGQNGFLGRHRTKVYGYLELAFKVGRSVTIGGFRGAFSDRTWDQVDGELESSRRERFGELSGRPQQARVIRVEPEVPAPDVPVSRVTLDVSGAGLRLQPGDRCGVLPEQSRRLIGRTLNALGARGDEVVALTAEWRSALALRAGFENRTEASVEEILRFGRIRAVEMRVAEALHALTQDVELERRLRDHSVQALELWELLTLVQRSGFELRKLYASDAGGPAGVLAGLVPPEHFRMYSVSKITDGVPFGLTAQLELLVAHLAYASSSIDGQVEQRVGTASSFLAHAAGRREPITITIERPARFRLPRSPRAPVVMLAGGTGVSPFRSFLHAQERQLATGPTLLLLGLRRQSEFCFEADVKPGLARGALELHLAFSCEAVSLRWDGAGERLVAEPAPPRRVPDLIADAVIAERLMALICEQQATVFICGRQRFAKACVDALEQMLAERVGAGDAQQLMRRLIAEERLNLEVFSGDSTDTEPAAIHVSDLSRRNNLALGYWMAIRERVYDITEFVQRHPGGAHTLTAHAGTDATEAYEKAHRGRAEIDAMREMYFIGPLRRLDLGRFSRLVESAHGHQITSLAAVHRGWVRTLYLLVEMQNALVKDQELQSAVTASGDPVTPRSAYKLARGVETHLRFIQGYLDVLFGQTLPALVQLTEGVLGTVAEAAPRPRESSRCLPAPSRLAVKEGLEAALVALTGSPEPALARERLTHVVEALEREDARMLAVLAERVRGGVLVFERHQASTPQYGTAELLATCAGLPLLLSEYEQTTLREVRRFGLAQHAASSAPPAALSEPVKTKLIVSAHWLMEEEREGRLVWLRRMAMPFGSVEEIINANQQVLSRIRPEHREWGVVVDMRHAPPRNDPAFEAAMRGLRDAVEVRFARTAVLLETAVGLLQVTRLTREDGAATFATQSEAAAVRFARGQPV